MTQHASTAHEVDPGRKARDARDVVCRCGADLAMDWDAERRVFVYVAVGDGDCELAGTDRPVAVAA
jgi:hypothetical protein